ncbi:MAG: hypothetical protein RMX63_00265 [Aulosira sp. ZfuCHP01]|nr:hypothetical protein [Aulosira sp. ZfuCHP01]
MKICRLTTIALYRAIEASIGQFKLILARCNYTNLRDRILAEFRLEPQLL